MTSPLPSVFFNNFCIFEQDDKETQNNFQTGCCSYTGIIHGSRVISRPG